MTIEELAKLYQDGTKWNDEMENVQNIAILGEIQETYEFYEEHKDELEMTFGQYIGLRRGMWQAEHGFVRPFDIEALKKRFEEKK